SDELGREPSKALAAPLRPAILDRHRAPVCPAELAQSAYEAAGPMSPVRRRARAEEADGRQLRALLRARCKRQHRSAAEQRDELASPHVDSLPPGTSRPPANSAERPPPCFGDPHPRDLDLLTVRDHAFGLGRRESGTDEFRLASRPEIRWRALA